MFTCRKLQELGNENQTRAASPERDIIAALLQHIQDVHDQTHLRYRVAYEVFWLRRGYAYKDREIKAICWRRDEAQRTADALTDSTMHYYKVSVIHVIKIGGFWYRANVNPIENIVGDPVTAQLSRLDPSLEIPNE